MSSFTDPDAPKHVREIPMGQRIIVKGLKGAPQHNGHSGTVGAFSIINGRYTVGLDSGVTIAVKIANLEILGKYKKAETEKKAGIIIGIDLGTTNSCVGVYNPETETVDICQDDFGSKTTPSFVAFEGEKRLVGSEAKQQQVSNIKNTIYDAKRIIGQRLTDKGVKSDVDMMQYKVVEGENNMPQICADFQGKEQKFSPEQISGMVLEHMKQIAEKHAGETISSAVVTVPAYFNDAQRAATVAAGRIAGLKIERIINEPTAAALAYGLDQLALDEEKGASNVLVFDMGGGTFDVSLMKLDGGIFEVLATGGDTRLGGEDFDHAIVHHVLNYIKKELKIVVEDDEKTFKKLKVAAEKAKITLSSAEVAKFSLPGLLPGGKDFEYDFTRESFDKIVKKWVDASLATVKSVLKDAKVSTKNVHEIVLVGGSTRIPAVQACLREYFDNKELCKSVNPDECVAYGAAVQGAILSGHKSSKMDQLLLIDVTPLSLGVEVDGKAMSTIIKRNTSIPCKQSSIYTTVEDWQTSIDINIYEGERSHVEGNNKLGDFVISGIERAKRGQCKVEVTFDLNENGMLTVSAKDQVTGAEANVQITAGGTRLDEETVRQMVEDAEKFAADDRKFVKKLSDKNELEKLVYDVYAHVNNTNDVKMEKKMDELREKADEVAAWLESTGTNAESADYDKQFFGLASSAKRLGKVIFRKDAHAREETL